MRRRTIALIQIPIIVLLCMPVFVIHVRSIVVPIQVKNFATTQQPYEYSGITESKAGNLDPVLIEHTGQPSGSQSYSSARTDTTKQPQSVTRLPSGDEENLYSAHCTGGYFLVGTAGSADFSSAQGTISLWIKWDQTAPNGRFWGQQANFESRWSNGRLVLDWGSDNTFTGIKNDWILNKWYFIAITWNQNNNSLAIYWGDEDNLPTVDHSTTSWTGSVAGLHSENDIMCSRGLSSDSVDGYVDDFRYYSFQRNLGELQSDYNTPLVGNEEYLEHYYSFENSLHDLAGSADLVQTGNIAFSQDVHYRYCGWRGEDADVEIRNLKQLVVLNGSCDSGNAGTNTDWNGDGIYYADGWLACREVISLNGYQRASYLNTGSKYITLENQGYQDISSPNAYRHYNGTDIYWYQMVNNSQHLEQFQFSMNYLYQRGPIGLNYANDFQFCFEIFNGASLLWNWSIDPTNISQRGIWYSVNPISVEIPNAPTTFEVRVALKVNTTSSFVEIPNDDPNLDGDSANGMYLTFQIDDISLVASNPPSFDGIALSITVPSLGITPIGGLNGIGSITLHHEYWMNSVIPFYFSSNSTVSFEYAVRIAKMSKETNSTFSQNLENVGAAFTANLDLGIAISFFTYIQSYPGISDLGFKAEFPKDWQEPTIEDPIGQDMTAMTSFQPGVLEIPMGLADSVGWWKVELAGVNHIYSINNERRPDDNSSWTESFIYRNGDHMRCIAHSGNGVPESMNISDAIFSWFTPTGNLWHEVNVSCYNSTLVESPAVSFSSSNSSIGTWLNTIYWTNGTEVAYGSSSFDLYHQLTVFPTTPSIDIKPGEEFTAAVFLYDQDAGNAILSGATVHCNWSTGEVQFKPNLAKGWWEADFNSSSIGTGDFILVIDVTIPYYDIDNCTINLSIPVAESIFVITLRASLFGAIAVIVAFATIAMSQRFYKSYTTSRQIELLALKRRLEDARNLIGLLVIHRSIGLPIYSRIIKGGFQESLLSSFISALSQFRAEFSWDEPKWTALPVTEVITVVLTDSLICALITVEESSINQKRQLELFGRELGTLYDQDEDTIKKMARRRDLSESLNPIFNEYFDGALLRRYIGIKDDLPERLNPVKTTLEGMDTEKGVAVEAIIKEMLMTGHNERQVYEMTLEAVDESYLIPAEMEETSIPDTSE